MGKGKRLKRESSSAALGVDFWHGGAAGRSIGENLIPAERLPAYSQFAAALSREIEEYRDDRVYVTTDRDAAYDFAIRHARHLGEAALYKVKPLGAIESDPDFTGNFCFSCRFARVIAVESEIFDKTTQLKGALLPYVIWDDSSPMYDIDGYPLPDKVCRYYGVTPEDLRDLGFGAEWPKVQRRCWRIVRERNPGLSQIEFNYRSKIL